MKILCIGDSLTEGDYGIYGKSCIANVHEENYPAFLSRLTGAEVLNRGRCGVRASGMLRVYREEVRGRDRLDDVDAVIVMLGSNGGLTAFRDSEENDAYDELVRLLRKDCPRAEIFLCPPPHITEGLTVEAMLHVNTIRQGRTFVRRYARDNGYRLIPTDAIPEFTAENEYLYQPNDGCHFSESGYRVLAEFIAGHLAGAV